MCGELGDAMAEDIRASPLAQLGQFLTKEIEDHGYTSSSGEFKKSDKPVLESPSATARPVEGNRFSISSWRAKIAQRAIDQTLTFDLRNARSEPSEIPTDAQANARGGAALMQSITDESTSGENNGELVQWLVGAFQARDAGRLEHTVVALRSLAKAGEMKRAEDMLALAREGILTLAREGWHMLQERHPAAVPNLSPPGQAALPTPEQHSARSSRCATYLVLGPRVSHRAQGFCESDDSTNGSAFCGSSCDTETQSTGFSPAAPSREPSGSIPEEVSSARSDATSASDRLHNVLSIDDDDLGGNESRVTLGHRDDWELQYIVNGVFDELRVQLESATEADLASLLLGARSRVLEWTVRRWRSCSGQPT